VTQATLGPEDEFLVIASDGLWEKLANEEAVGLIHDTVKHPAMAAQRYPGLLGFCGWCWEARHPHARFVPPRGVEGG
jgi:Protein phosphatase 2C